MRIRRVAVADGKAVIYLDSMEIPVVVSEGQEVWFSEEDGFTTLWHGGPADKTPLARAPE